MESSESQTMESSAIAPQSVRLSRLPSFRGLAALLRLALRQQFHGWRPAVLGLLFLLPGTLAVIIYWTRGRCRSHVRRPQKFSTSVCFST